AGHHTLSTRRGGGYTDIAGPLEKFDPEPSAALGFPCGGHDDSRGALGEIRGAKRGHEPVQLSVPLDTPEALRGAQQTEPDPPPHWAPDTPGAGSSGHRPGALAGRGRRGYAPCGAGSVE